MPFIPTSALEAAVAESQQDAPPAPPELGEEAKSPYFMPSTGEYGPEPDPDAIEADAVTEPPPSPEQASAGLLLGVGALVVLGVGTWLLAGRK